MVNILISGYYGFDNIGDESILRTLVSSLREHIPDCSLTVLSHNPTSTREKYGVEAVDRMSPVAILRAVKKCDMLISGGGSLLQDVTSSKSLHYYLSIIRCAEFFHKKVFIYSQGIGPIDRPGNRRAAAAALKRADGIVVRDERSAALLEEIGIARDKVVITADPVIRMKKPDGDVGAEILRKAGVSLDGRLTVGWAIRERDTDSRFVKELLRSIQMMKDKYNAQSVLIPFHYEEDGEVCRHIAAQLPDDTAVCLNEKYLSEDMLSIIGNMDLLVGVRLHSLIYAAIMGVPLIGISYDPKCTAFLNSVGLDKLSTKENFTAELFLPEAERVLDLLNKAYYAMKKTLVPLLINLGVLVLNLILNRVFYTDTGVALATSLALTIGAIAMTIQLFHGTKIVRLVPLLKGLAATAAMAVVLYGGRSLLVAADDSKLMLVVKCGLTGVVGCVVYVLVSMILKQNIIADTIKKFKK